MIPKNRDLFSDLNGDEVEFLLPDEYPWQALERVEAHQNACVDAFQAGRMQDSWPLNGKFKCIRTFEEVVMGRHHGTVPDFGSEHVRGGKGMKSDEDTKILGPIMLGEGVTLRQGAIITGPCWIGDDVFIGHSCRIKNSIILPGARIIGQTRVSHAIIGRNVRIGAGVSLEDEPFEGGEIIFRCETGDISQREAIIPTGRSVLSLIAGDNAWIGAGAACAAGTILMPATRVQECHHIRERGRYFGKLRCPSRFD